MMIRYVILWILAGGLFLSSQTYGEGKKAGTEKEYFIISTNAELYEGPEAGAKSMFPLSFGNKALLAGGRMEKNRYRITVNGTNGWVNEPDISITPKNWVRFNGIEGLVIYYPKEYQYQFKKGKPVTDVNETYVEHYLYNKESFVRYTKVKAFHSVTNENNDLIKLDYYEKDAYYYSGNYGEDAYRTFSLEILDKAKKGFIMIEVVTGKVTPTPEEELIAKKILFSVRLKETGGQLNTPSILYLLTGDNVNVRAEASTNSAALVKLSKGAKVTLLKRSDIVLTVGDKKGFWAYIDTGVKDKKTGETIKGWVFDYYLKKAE